MGRGAVLVFLLAAPAAADDLVAFALKVRIAVAEGRDLAPLLADGLPDPWLLADELCATGDADAALALARALPAERYATLPDYVRARQERGEAPGLREGVREARALRIRNRGELALGRLDALPAAPDPVLKAIVATERARALADLDRHEESQARFLEAAKTAAKAGWRRREAECLCFVPLDGALIDSWTFVAGSSSLKEGEATLRFGVVGGSELLAILRTREDARPVMLGDASPLFDACGAVVGTDGRPDRRILDLLLERLWQPLRVPASVRRLHVLWRAPVDAIPFSFLAGDRVVVHENHPSWGPADPEPPSGRGILAVGAACPRADETALGREDFHERAASLPRWRVLHLGARPELNRLPLRDGVLFPSNVAWVKADLAVLAWSGSTPPRGTDRLAGRAFSVAPRQLVHLWDLDPEASAAFLERFYALWNPADGEPKDAATALREAQDFVASQEKWKDPFYWAGWQLWVGFGDE